MTSPFLRCVVCQFGVGVLICLCVQFGCNSVGEGENKSDLMLIEPASPSADESLGSQNASDAVGVESKGSAASKVAIESKGKILPPVDKDTEGIILPIPEGVSYMEIKGFMEEYRGAYLKYLPLGNDYRAYFSLSITDGGVESEDKEAIKARIEENFERAHWVFLFGVQEIMDYMSTATKGTLMIDREENFVARIKTITALAGALTEVSGEQKYKKYARDIYISMSKKHFGRTVRPRGGVQPKPTPTEAPSPVATVSPQP